MLRALLVALASFAVIETSASACPGQTGKVIFEDKFTDDSGGWAPLSAPDVEIKDGSLLLRPNPRGAQESSLAVQSFIVTFPAGDADYCVEFILPKQIAPDNNLEFGLGFFQIDSLNYFSWTVNTSNTVWLTKYSGANKASDIFTDKSPSVRLNLEPNAVNSLRVVAKDSKLTLFLNGSQVKVIRAPTPSGELHFGVRATVDKVSDADPVVQVKSFKVTTGQ